jgi:hypothetical protein
LIAIRSVSGADYPTSSPTKWDLKSERECPVLGGIWDLTEVSLEQKLTIDVLL